MSQECPWAEQLKKMMQMQKRTYEIGQSLIWSHHRNFCWVWSHHGIPLKNHSRSCMTSSAKYRKSERVKRSSKPSLALRLIYWTIVICFNVLLSCSTFSIWGGSWGPMKDVEVYWGPFILTGMDGRGDDWPGVWFIWLKSLPFFTSSDLN